MSNQCPHCGELLEGDGYTEQRRCPNYEGELFEPDADTVYCEESLHKTDTTALYSDVLSSDTEQANNNNSAPAGRRRDTMILLNVQQTAHREEPHPTAEQVIAAVESTRATILDVSVIVDKREPAVVVEIDRALELDELTLICEELRIKRVAQYDYTEDEGIAAGSAAEEEPFTPFQFYTISGERLA